MTYQEVITLNELDSVQLVGLDVWLSHSHRDLMEDAAFFTLRYKLLKAILALSKKKALYRHKLECEQDYSKRSRLAKQRNKHESIDLKMSLDEALLLSRVLSRIRPNALTELNLMNTYVLLSGQIGNFITF